MTEVTAKIGKNGTPATVVVDLGDNCQDAIDRFGADVVFSNYLANVKITVQSAIRRYLEKGSSAEEIQKKLDGYKPGVPMERTIDPIATIKAKFDKMSDEEKREALEELMAKLAG